MRKKSTEKTVTMGLRIPVELRDKLEQIASKEVRNLSHQIIHFLNQAIRVYENSK